MRLKDVLLFIAVICLILTATPCAASFDSFANFGDIKGESTDKDHKDWVMVLSYNHQVSQPASQPPSQASGRSSQSNLPAHGDIQIVKFIDKSSPKLVEACAYGKLISSVDLDLVRNGQIYLRIHMENVVIASVQALPPELLVWSPALSSAPISAALQESVHLRYGRITWTYMSPSGGGSSTGSYDSSRRRFSSD
ncbi:MAG TPA: type VI secretion system tube protein Hcp [Syntrophales bacterium]|nr:type VI secretion system tube protein Hcp [Syntrophales bacterium]